MNFFLYIHVNLIGSFFWGCDSPGACFREGGRMVPTYGNAVHSSAGRGSVSGAYLRIRELNGTALFREKTQS